MKIFLNLKKFLTFHAENCGFTVNIRWGG